MEDESETEAEDKDENRNGYMPPQIHLGGAQSEGDVPPSRSSNRLTRLPPRAANPSLDFGTGRRHGNGSQSTATRPNRKHRHVASTSGTTSPAGPTAMQWPQRSLSSTSDSNSAARCTSYCCAHALGLVELDRWLHARGLRSEWFKDGLNAVLHCQVTVQAVTELCNARNAAAAAKARAKGKGKVGLSVSLPLQPTGSRASAVGRVKGRNSARELTSATDAPAAAGPAPAPPPPFWQQGSSGSSGALPEGVGVLRTASLPEGAMGVPRGESEGVGGGETEEAEPRTPPEAHVFFFSYGCVVMWGLSQHAEEQLIELLKGDYAQVPLLHDEVDDFGYVLTPNADKTVIHKDLLRLATTGLSEKLAVAFALAQSAKLGVFEATVEQTIQNTRSIPERMARDGKISLGRKQITKQIGQLFVDRASINLHSDILDNPDYFWEDDEWLPAYARVSKYLEITRRAEVLNKRLDIIKELFDMLASEYHNSHASMLEWIVIVLILIEVFFQILELWYQDRVMISHGVSGLVGAPPDSTATVRFLRRLIGGTPEDF